MIKFVSITKENIMKKILSYSVFILSIILFNSCDNEPLTGFDLEALAEANSGSGSTGSDTSIVGTWKMTAWNVNEGQDLNQDGTNSTNLLDEMDCYNNETILFNSNNTAVSTSTSYADIELNLVIGTTNTYNYTITCVPEIENTDLTWAQSGNVVATTSAGSTNNFTLDGNQLSFLIPEGFTVVSDDSSTTVIQDLTIVYTKQ
jgi:hypothetical protein